jgi:concanavalin A-like lectin/glucanase superfamily protein
LFGIRATKLQVAVDPGAVSINWADSLTASLLHWFPLNEQAGTKLVDVCGRATAANIWTGTINRTGSEFGRALEFANNAASNAIDTGYAVKLPLNALTVAAWVRPQIISGHWTFPVCAWSVTGANSQFALTFGDNVDGAPKFAVVNASGTSFITGDGTPVMVSGLWYHLLGVFDGATAAIYLNGTLSASVAAVTTINNATQTTLTLGDNSLANAFYAGGLAHVGIWNRALKFEEIRRLYSDPLAPLWLPGQPIAGATFGATQSGSGQQAGVGAVAAAPVLNVIGSTALW